VKHDLRRKARFVAGGHVTKTPKEETCSGVNFVVAYPFSFSSLLNRIQPHPEEDIAFLHLFHFSSLCHLLEDPVRVLMSITIFNL